MQTIFDQSEPADAAQHRLGLMANVPVPTTFDDFAVRLNILPESANRLAIIQPQDEAELSKNLLSGESTLSGVDALFCPEGYYVPEMEPGSEPCKRVNFNQPGFPQQFVVSWEESGAAWQTAVPEAYTDLTAYTAVQLRAALDPLSPLNTPDEPQSFTIEFADSSGNREQVPVFPIDFPVGETTPNDYFEGESFTGHVYMSSLRIPLGELTAVDLTHITEIALIFDQTPTGTLFLADLELIK